MTLFSLFPRALAPALALPAALALAGCGGASDTAANLLAFNTPSAPTPAPVIQTARAPNIECPEVEVLGGAGAHRVGGPGQALRYQYSLGDIARECSLEGGQLGIKVGIEGRVILGPAGSPGAFSAPLRVTIRRESDGKPAVTKSYRIAASVPAGETSAVFTLVTEPLYVPYLREQADADYAVSVSFGDGPAEPRQPRRRRR